MRPTTFGRLPSPRAGGFALRRPPRRTGSADAARAMLALVAVYLIYLGLILAFAYGIPALLGDG